MKSFLVLLLCNWWNILNAQPDFKIFYKTKPQGFILYASNNEHYPLSIKLDLKLKNLMCKDDQQKLFVIAENTKEVKLVELNAEDPASRYSFSYVYNFDYGDINLQKYDSDYAYELPYKNGNGFLIGQGYNGFYSHQNENALDFSMPEGTEILAARDGIILKVEESNTESCPTEECQKFNNYILIYHPDGTIAMYTHIQYKSSKVKPGEQIRKGDPIAFSGHTGWTVGPHLHFVCFLPGYKKERTIMTKFKINSGNELAYLKEKQTYVRDY